MKRLVAALFLLLPLCLDAAAPPTVSDLPKGARLRIGSPRLRHGGLIRWLSFSPDGKTLASASHDRSVSVWDVSSGQERFRLVGHNGDVVCLSFAPNGATLATSGSDGTIRLWALTGPKAGSQLDFLSTRADSVEAVAYSPDGKRLAAGGDDGTLHVYDAATQREVFKRQLDRGIRALAWSADSQSIATNGDAKSGVAIWNAADGKLARTFGENAVGCLAFAPKGMDLLTWDDSGTMRLWNAEVGKQKKQFRSADEDAPLIYQVAFAADGKSVFAGTADGGVDEWDHVSGKRKRQMSGLQAGAVLSLAVAGDRLATTGRGDYSIRIHDLKTGKALTPLHDLALPVTALTTTDRGRTLVTLHGTGKDAGEMRLWDAATGKALETPKVGRVVAVAGRPADAGLWLVNPKGHLLNYDLKKKVSTTADNEGPLAALAVSGDGALVAGVLRNGLVPVYVGGQRKHEARGRERGAVPVPSHDGSLVAVVGKAANVAIFATKSGEEAAGVVGHGGGTLTAAFSPDDRLLATGGRDRYLRLWEVQSRRERVKPIAHADWVRAVAFSRDGRLVATATTAGLVALFDAQTGRLEAELPGHRGPVTGLTFADKDSLISAGQDGTILVWDVTRIKLGGLSPKVLAAAEREKHWKTLASDDPIPAALAARELARDGTNTVKRIVDSIKPIDAGQVAKWIEELDDEKFAKRDAAAKQLAALGRFVEGALRKTLKKKPSLEQHRRIEELLDALKGAQAGDHLRALRSVELLEQIGGVAATKKLRELADGADDTELTTQAKAALGRMKQ